MIQYKKNPGLWSLIYVGFLLGIAMLTVGACWLLAGAA